MKRIRTILEFQRYSIEETTDKVKNINLHVPLGYISKNNNKGFFVQVGGNKFMVIIVDDNYLNRQNEKIYTVNNIGELFSSDIKIYLFETVALLFKWVIKKK